MLIISSMIYFNPIQTIILMNISYIWPKIQVGLYDKEIKEMQSSTKEEYVAIIKRKSHGFSRGVSKYRGVAK